MGVYTSTEGILEITHCDTAREFLNFLKISDERWLPENVISSPWIFRGHRRHDWNLEPSAIRTTTTWFDNVKKQYFESVDYRLKQIETKYLPGEYVPEHDVLRELVLQVYAEQLAVEEFANLANQVGHQIPDEDESRLGGEELSIERVISGFFLNISVPSLREYKTFYPETILFSLAQHHGIPTRLLDWTFMPYVAAFFAAEEAIKSRDSLDYNIAVWAINRTGLSQISDLRLVTHKRAKITYLHAQGGVFIYDSDANMHFVKYRRWRNFEEIIASSLQNPKQTPLRKVTVSVTEAFELLRLLAAENVSRAHLMPTYDNVTETLKTFKNLRIGPESNGETGLFVLG
jgi:hypothetical protein